MADFLHAALFFCGAKIMFSNPGGHDCYVVFTNVQNFQAIQSSKFPSPKSTIEQYSDQHCEKGGFGENFNFLM